MSERPLRSREHIAQKLYTCDNCLKDIEPGDLYEAAYFATTEPVYVRAERS